MKRRTLKTFCALTAIAITLPVFADQAQVDRFKQQFKGVRAPELPGRAAQAVAGAHGNTAIVVDVVSAAISVKRASAPAVVSAIARSTPAAASTAAATAAGADAKLVASVTRAAVSGAPAELEAIVSAVTKARPNAFMAIGSAAAEAAPKSDEAILKTISSAAPALKSVIARATTDATAKHTTSTTWILKRADALLRSVAKSMHTTPEVLLAGEVTSEMNTKLASISAVLPAPPVVGPPYTPGGGSPGEITISDTGEAPTGRDYSAP